MRDNMIKRKYSSTSISDFKKLILARNHDSDEAAFYLLQYAINDDLRKIYSIRQPEEEFQDTLSDFFIYLRNGKKNDNNRPYECLEGIRFWEAFKGWIIKSYSHYLVDKITAENNRKDVYDKVAHQPITKYTSEHDLYIRYLGVFFSDINAIFDARERFIFYRSMLTKLNKKEVIDNEDMAQAMGISYSNYRQIEHRTNLRAKTCLQDIKRSGASIKAKNEPLAKRVELDFENITEIIHDLYKETLLVLPNREAIIELRYSEKKKTPNAEAEKDSSGEKFSLKISHNDNYNSGVKYSLKGSYRELDILKNKYQHLVKDEDLLQRTYTNSSSQREQSKMSQIDNFDTIIDYSYMFTSKGRCWNKVLCLLNENC